MMPAKQNPSLYSRHLVQVYALLDLLLIINKSRRICLRTLQTDKQVKRVGSRLTIPSTYQDTSKDESLLSRALGNLSKHF